MIKAVFIIFLSLLVYAQSPNAYKKLGESIEAERAIYAELLSHEKFTVYKEDVDIYFQKVDAAFGIGEALDAELQNAESENEEVLQSSYLRALRSLEKPRESLRKIYFKEVQNSMQKGEDEYLLFLITGAKEFLDKNPRLKKQVLLYSTDKKALEKQAIIKELKAEKKLDDESYAFMQKMEDEYKAYQEVLKKAEALKLRKLLVSQKKGGVIVYAQEKDGNIEFVIENLFEMHVSATLHINEIKGYKTDGNLPVKVVLKAKEKRSLIELKNISNKKKVGYFKSHLSWSKGAVDAQPDMEYVYDLPFHESQKVSQGFNGNTSHKGNAKYAVDFAMPIGTEVYASRAGKVVEIVQGHNKHGMSSDMSQFANYLIIEHSDKTMGRYFHLKQNGVKVRLGSEVKKGELIALSGNTGRTSGSHLHFVVTRAEVFKDEYRSISIPIKFLCSEGVLSNPLSGKSYCAVQAKAK